MGSKKVPEPKSEKQGSLRPQASSGASSSSPQINRPVHSASRHPCMPAFTLNPAARSRFIPRKLAQGPPRRQARHLHRRRSGHPGRHLHPGDRNHGAGEGECSCLKSLNLFSVRFITF